MTTQNSTWNRQTSLALLIAGAVFVVGLLAISTLTGCGDDDGTTGGSSLPIAIRNAKKEKIPYSRAVKFFRLIPKLEKAGMSSEAGKCLSAAADACEEVFDNTKRASIFSRLAKVQASHRKKSRAGKSLNKAEEAAEKIESLADQIGAMASIAAGYQGIDEKYGVKYLIKAEKRVEKIESPSEQARLSGNIAKAYHALGKADEATRMIDSMVTEAAKLTDALKAATALVTIARVYNTVGDKKSAWKQCKAAKSKAAKIEIPGTQAIVLCDIALAAHKAGHKKDALKMVAQAKELAEDSDQSPEYQNAALEKWEKTKRKLNK